MPVFSKLKKGYKRRQYIKTWQRLPMVSTRRLRFSRLKLLTKKTSQYYRAHSALEDDMI